MCISTHRATAAKYRRFIFSGTNGTAEKHVEFAYANIADCMYAIAY